MDTRSRFVHAPLDLTKEVVRVVKILPEESDETIKCTIHHTPLATTHTCLSYRWGPAGGSRYVLLNGRPFKVRRNLWKFLESARALRMDDQLWIDAMCIDQENVSERNHQVQQMAKLYGQARHVFAWVGTGSDESIDRAFKLLGDRERPPARSTRLQLLHEIKRLLYWERLWIVQELLLAREGTILYGRTAVSWARIREYLSSCDLSPESSIMRLTIDPRVLEKGRTLLFLAQGFRQSVCSNIHDKVYGLLGLVKGGRSFPIDYEESVVSLFWRTLTFQSDAEPEPEERQILGLQRALSVAPGMILNYVAERPWSLCIPVRTTEDMESGPPYSQQRVVWSEVVTSADVRESPASFSDFSAGNLIQESINGCCARPPQSSAPSESGSRHSLVNIPGTSIAVIDAASRPKSYKAPFESASVFPVAKSGFLDMVLRVTFRYAERRSSMKARFGRKFIVTYTDELMIGTGRPQDVSLIEHVNAHDVELCDCAPSVAPSERRAVYRVWVGDLMKTFSKGVPLRVQHIGNPDNAQKSRRN